MDLTSGPTNASTFRAAHRQHPGDLPRVLGASHAGAIVIGTIIGSGIFLVPYEIIRAAGSAWLVYLAWIAGGVLSLAGALTYSELGAMMPRAGGDYVFLRNAYGDLPAFLYMWTWFAVSRPASIAALTIGLARTLGVFHSLRWLDAVSIAAPFEVRWSQIFAIGAAWFITGLNCLGMKRAGAFQLFVTWVKVLLIIWITAFCFTGRPGRWANFHSAFASAQGGFAGFMIALIATLWAYDGWSDLTLVAGEVKRPERNLPLALIGGVGTVAALYMLMNAAIEYVLPAARIAASPRPAAAAMEAVSGHWGAALVSVGMALSILAALNGSIMSGARVPFAAARDRLFFARLAFVHPRFQSPSAALLGQASIGTLLLLLVRSFQQLFEIAIFSEWLFYMLTASTIFVYRRRFPAAKRPFRAWGYPAVPTLFILASAVLLYYSFASNLSNSLIGLAIMLAGLPLYLVIRRRTPPPRRLPPPAC